MLTFTFLILIEDKICSSCAIFLSHVPTISILSRMSVVDLLRKSISISDINLWLLFVLKKNIFKQIN